MAMIKKSTVSWEAVKANQRLDAFADPEEASEPTEEYYS